VRVCVWRSESKWKEKKKKMIDFARVQKELQECSRDIEASGIRVSPKSDNLGRLIGTIPGPIGTPYEGGTFQIDISLPGLFLAFSNSIFSE
jgi:ubiquitin-protein ligase